MFLVVLQVRIVGEGGQGYVAAAHDSVRGQEVALKILERRQAENKYAKREIINHSKLRHPHIIRLDELFLVENSLILLMEYANQGDLHRYVFTREKGLDEDEARSLAQQLFLALHYSHLCGIANRDIKLENILLTARPGKKPLVKLADFGFSKDENNNSSCTSRLGTVHYCAPEILVPGDISEPNNNKISYNAKQADIWSCGVVLYCMLMKQYPFQSDKDKNLNQIKKTTVVVKRIISGEFSVPAHVSEDCQDLLSRMLNINPHERPTSEMIWEHPWVKVGLKSDMLAFNEKVLNATNTEKDDEIVQNIRKAIAEAVDSIPA